MVVVVVVVVMLYYITLHCIVLRCITFYASIIVLCLFAFSALTLLAGRQKEHPARKKIE